MGLLTVLTVERRFAKLLKNLALADEGALSFSDSRHIIFDNRGRLRAITD